MRYFARIGERDYECVVEPANGALHVTVDGRRYRADLRHIPASHTYSLLLDGKSYEFALREQGEETELMNQPTLPRRTQGGWGGPRCRRERKRKRRLRRSLHLYKHLPARSVGRVTTRPGRSYRFTC